MLPHYLTSREEKIKNIILAWAVGTILVCFILLFLNVFAPDYLPARADLNGLQTLISDCMVAPLWEEALFRFVPFEIARRLLTKDQFTAIRWPLILLTGLVFGWMHGNVYNVFIQGTYGIMLGWLYVKNDFSYKSTVVAHGLWNYMITFGFPLLY